MAVGRLFEKRLIWQAVTFVVSLLLLMRKARGHLSLNAKKAARNKSDTAYLASISFRYWKMTLKMYLVMAERRMTPTSFPSSSTTGSFLNFFFASISATRAML